MVASLFNRCLLAVRNAVEYGDLWDLDRLPVTVRREVFACLVRHRTLENPNCVRCYERPAFFDGFNAFDLRELRCCSDCCSLIEGVLRTRLSLDANLAQNITCLGVRFCTFRFDRVDQRFWHQRATHMEAVCDIIARCPNLTELKLRVDSSEWPKAVATAERRKQHRLSSAAAFRQIVKALLSDNDNVNGRRRRLSRLSLRELDLRDLDGRCGSLPAAFGALCFLQLARCSLNPDWYRGILCACRDSLVELSLTCVTLREYGASPIGYQLLPVSLPALRGIRIYSLARFEMDWLCVLDQSPALQAVYVTLRYPWNVRTLERLSRLRADVRVRLGSKLSELRCASAADYTAVAEMLGYRLAELYEIDYAQFDRQELERFFSLCSNLESLRVWRVTDQRLNDGIQLSLSQLFGDVDRAARLSRLTVHCSLSATAVGLLFRNCRNLNRLELQFQSESPVVEDADLLNWIASGACPSRVTLLVPHTLTDDGVIPLFRACGMNLNVFKISHRYGRLTVSALRVLMEECLMVEKVEKLYRGFTLDYDYLRYRTFAWRKLHTFL